MPSIQNNLERRLADAFHGAAQKRGLELTIGPMLDGSVTQNLVNGGLAIHGAASALAKTVNAIYAVVDGTLVTLGAADLPALTGFNVSAGKYGVCLFLIDAFGNVSIAYSDGTAAAIGNIAFPTIPTGKACIGFIIVTNAGAFTGGTTALDTATTVYVNVTGDFNPGLINSL